MAIIDGEMLWRQFAAAIDALGEALRKCPDALWGERLWQDEPDQWVAQGFSAFWYLGYHTLFWLDLYLTGAEEGFAPPAPFDLVEMEANETLPRLYSREELLGYLELCRQRSGTLRSGAECDGADAISGDRCAACVRLDRERIAIGPRNRHSVDTHRIGGTIDQPDGSQSGW